MLSSKRNKIFSNTIQDLVCLALTKLLNKPYFRVAPLLTVVTAALAVFEGMTSRDNIARHCAGAIGVYERNKMIGGYDVPESGGLSTVNAAPIPVIETMLPVGSGKIVGQCVFTSAPSPDTDLLTYPSLWGFSISLPAFLIHIRILATVFTGVFSVALNTPKIQTVSVSLARTKILKCCWKVFLALRAIFTAIWRGRFWLDPLMRGNKSLMRSAISIQTRFAAPTQSIFAVFVSVKEFTTTRVNLKTLTTAFYRGIHSAFLSLRSEDVIGRRRNYRFLGATLADGLIIPQFRGISL